MKLNIQLKLAFLAILGILIPNYFLYSQAGGSAVPFILISPDARASGMGETGTAISDDLNAVFWNPSGLAFNDSIKINDEDYVPWFQGALTYSRWLPQFNADLYYAYGSVGKYLKEMNGTAAFTFIFMNLGEFTRTDINGQELGKFLSNEFALGLSYGTIIAKDLGIGVQLKYILSNLAPASPQTGGEAGRGQSFAFDLGLLWRPQELNILGLNLQDRLSLGINLQNVGPKITYKEESDPLPTSLRMGGAITLTHDEYNDLKFACDISKLLVRRDSLGSDPLPKSLYTGWKNPGVELSIGSEYWYAQAVALRIGYFSEPNLLGNRKFWNFGAGVRYDIFELDFSFINTVDANNPLANTMRFSMLVNFR